MQYIIQRYSGWDSDYINAGKGYPDELAVLIMSHYKRKTKMHLLQF